MPQCKLEQIGLIKRSLRLQRQYGLPAVAGVLEVGFIATTLGHHNLISTLDFTEVEQPTHLPPGRIMPIDGVQSTAPSHCLRQITHQSELRFIL